MNQNCTDFNIKIQFEFIKYESKVSGKKNISLCSAISAQTSTTGPQPTAAGGFQRAPPRPGRNLGLGREFGLAPYPAWAAALAQSLAAVHLDRAVERAARGIKNPGRPRLPQP